MQQMPGTTILMAIVGFSIGAEVGHQIVLLPVFTLLQVVRHSRPHSGVQMHRLKMVKQFLSAGIAAAGLYYLNLALIAAA
jgi:hypothetical protein